MSNHESFDRKHEVAVASERSFGLVFAGVFTLVAGFRGWAGHADALAWLGGAAIVALLGLFWTAPLAPLNRLWMKLGALLHLIVTPVVMSAIFFLTITPIGWLMRLLGKDILHLKRDPAAVSYWVDCTAEAERRQPMKDQF